VIAPGLPVQVSCSAQSLNSQQFSTDTSRGQESTFQLAFPEAILQPSLSRFIGLPVDVVLSIFPPSSSEQGDDIIFRCSAERVLSNESDFSEMSRNFCVDILQNVGMKNCKLIVVCVSKYQFKGTLHWRVLTLGPQSILIYSVRKSR
jgi:hypothetical protein